MILVQTVDSGFAEPGVPALAVAQMLETGALELDAVARFRSLMAQEAVDEETLIHSGGQVPLRWFRDVFPELDMDQAIEIALACAVPVQLTTFSLFSVPLVSAGSVAEIVELLTFLPLVSTALNAQFHSGDDGLIVGLSGATADPELDCMAVVYCGAVLMRFLDVLTGESSGVTFHVGAPAPAQQITVNEAASQRLVFGATTTYLHVPQQMLSEVCRFSDPIAYRVAIADLQQALDRTMGGTTFTRRVQSLLADGGGIASANDVAGQLSISASTLKRRLQEEGTTFRAVLEAHLRDRALVQLLDRTVSVSNVAADLGYSDLTNFSHAFKRWTGYSPSQFRRAQIQDPADG